MIKDEPINSSGSFKLEYMTQKSQNNQVSETTDSLSNMRQQCVLTVGPTVITTTRHSRSNDLTNE